MTPEQKAAMIMARAAMLNAEVASMEADNADRERRGEAVAWTGKEFNDIINSYPDLQWNNLVEYLRD